MKSVIINLKRNPFQFFEFKKSFFLFLQILNAKVEIELRH